MVKDLIPILYINSLRLTENYLTYMSCGFSSKQKQWALAFHIFFFYNGLESQCFFFSSFYFINLFTQLKNWKYLEATITTDSF